MKEDLSGVLSEHAFVSGLSEEYVKFLTGCTANVKFQPREFLFREGDAANVLYLVREGQAAIQVYSPGKGTTTLATIGPNEIAGWSWVVEPYVSHFDVVAISTVRAISVNAQCLRKKCQSDPEFGYQMLARMTKVMEHRLEATRLQLLDLYGRSS